MTTEQRAEHDLASLETWAKRLRQLAEEWDSPGVDDRERLAFHAEWDNIVGRLAKTEGLARDGLLSPTTMARLRQVADELAALVPTMQRLGLRCPDPDALARARIATAA